MQGNTQDPSKVMPPIRPKINLSGRDMQPDVLAQVVESAGYQPSSLTQNEMAAGYVGVPLEKIQIQPLNPAMKDTATKNK